MLHESREVFASQGAFCDRVPNHLGLFGRDRVIGGSQVKDQVIGVQIFRLCDVHPKMVNVLRFGSKTVWISPMMFAFDDVFVPALIASSVFSIGPYCLAA